MKQFRQQYKQQNRPKKSDLLIGTEAIILGINTGIGIDKILVNNRQSEKDFQTLFALAAQHQIAVQKVPIEKINGLNVGEHNGAVAYKSKIQYQDIQTILDHVVEQGKVPLFLILDGITDVRNIGGIARSAYALGAHGIIIPDRGVAAINEDAILTSAGAFEKIPVCRVNSLLKAVDTLHLNGLQVFASEMTAKQAIHEIDFTIPCAIIMGGEENGIFPALMKSCDATFNIPMQNNFESLNVSVATGIILYEVQKQRL